MLQSAKTNAFQRFSHVISCDGNAAENVVYAFMDTLFEYPITLLSAYHVNSLGFISA